MRSFSARFPRNRWRAANAVSRLRFKVTRQFSTVAAAAAYVATAFSALPTNGLATLICGALGETPVTCTFSAVLEAMPDCTFRGTRTETTFLLRGGAITTLGSSVTNVVDGASLLTTYTYPPGGTIDGGSAVDLLLSGALGLDGGTFS